MPLRPILAILVAGALPLSGCAATMADRGCFSARPSVLLPDKTRVLTNATNGSAGRDLLDALYGRDVNAVIAKLAADPRLASTQVIYDRAKLDRAPDGQYGDVLTLAVAQCDAQMLAALLAAGLPADGEQRGEALTLALLADTPDMADLLLKAGASPDPQKNGGRDVLREMIMFGHEPAVSLLIRNGLDVRWVDNFGVSRLQVAVDAEQFRVAELLVDAGASLWSISGTGHMPVHILAQPMIQNNPQQDAARQRLLQKAQQPGLPWPPPSAKEIRALVVGGNWPTPALQAAGIPPLTPEALADMKARYAK
jgi:hypothetical protein